MGEGEIDNILPCDTTAGQNATEEIRRKTYIESSSYHISIQMAVEIYWLSMCGNSSLYDAFWSSQLSVDTADPDFTRCFQDTVITWLSYGWLMLVSPVYLIYLQKKPSRCRMGSCNGLCRMKLVIAAILCTLHLLDLAVAVYRGVPSLQLESPASLLRPALQSATLALVVAMITLEHRTRVKSSGVLWIFWFLLALLEGIRLRSNIAHRFYTDDTSGTFRLVIFYVSYAMFLLQSALSFFVDHIEKAGKTKIQDEHSLLLGEQNDDIVDAKTSPEADANFPSRLLFLWITRFLIRGYRKSLRFEDLYDIDQGQKCKNLVERFERATENIQSNINSRGDRKDITTTVSLFLALAWTLKGWMILSTFCRFVATALLFANPPILRLLIVFVSSKGGYTWQAIIYAVLLCLSKFAFCVFIHWWLYAAYLASIQARTILNAVVYRKVLRLSTTARHGRSVGETVNLVSVDSQKVEEMFIYFDSLWNVPVCLVVCTVYLWHIVGPAALAGLVVLAVLIPTNAVFLGGKIGQYQTLRMKINDSRMRLTNEILNGMKVLKFYAWETLFQKKLLQIRKKELTLLRKIAYVNAITAVTWFMSPYLISLAIFAAYVVSSDDHVLTAETAFMTLSLINILTFPMSLLPMAVKNIGQGVVSLKRIAEFLSLDEIPANEDSTTRTTKVGADVITMESATYSWDGVTPVLRGFDLQVPRGSLVAVVGHVGSGKSSMLSAILGEMARLSGRCAVEGSLAYVPQQPWIQNVTLRDNILFGRVHVATRYQKVVSACAMLPDLQILPAGDMTEIGEKGTNLSGGQRQRLSLARGVYQDTDVYLLDDPLSAVDVHVAKHLFQHVIGPTGLLANKTRILATHNVTVLPMVDRIVVLHEGRIVDVGTYEEVSTTSETFARLLKAQNEETAKVEADGGSQSELTVSSATATESSGTEAMSVSKGKPRKRKRIRYETRHRSPDDIMPFPKDSLEGKDTLIEEEESCVGAVKVRTIWGYIDSGGLGSFAFMACGLVFFVLSQILTNVWLSSWSNDPVVNGTRDRGREYTRLGAYGGFGILQLFFVSMLSIALACGSVCASSKLYSALLGAILRAPVSFFDTTPIGRIVNRFAKDMDIVDSALPAYISLFLIVLVPFISTIGIILYSFPVFAAVLIPFGVIFVLVKLVYSANLRQLKRIDSVSRSPIYSYFEDTLVGLASVRAYRRQADFTAAFDVLVDRSQRAWYLYIICVRWLGVVMETVAAIFVLLVSLFVVFESGSLSAGVAGLALTYALQVTAYINLCLRSSADVEANIVSVERIKEYIGVGSEAPWCVPTHTPPASWPQHGAIEFIRFSTRYRPGLDLVLRGISAQISPREKIGVVGRTGAGKSSLTLALFRIIEAADGQIAIDGVRIADLGLHDLRTKLTIIPQDPVLFSGSLRDNLDPFAQYSDSQIWLALRKTNMETAVTALVNQLEYDVGENGDALSVGQRQLLCLARALLAKTKIVILDEATAAVDVATDQVIQRTIRIELADCTVITVAHRLNTVLQYDRLMVLDAGHIQEFDTPRRLLSNRRSVLYAMAKQLKNVN
ncbi:Multidrug resistance-associated protein 1 [Lamellibrachia satsuma]|nr:Multidrug resistance-associated protein 1 [Lamellibrachia satsuma]